MARLCRYCWYYSDSASFLQVLILIPVLPQQCIHDLPDDVVFIISIYADDTTFHPKCDQVSNFKQQLKLASEFECDLCDTLHWSMKWIVDFNAGKIQLVSLNCSNNCGAID